MFLEGYCGGVYIGEMFSMRVQFVNFDNKNKKKKKKKVIAFSKGN